MNKIYKVEEIPEGEMIYLSKGIFGWGVVNPIKNEDGSTNWFNLIVGSWSNLIGVLFILFLLFIFLIAYKEVSSQLVTCVGQQTITKIGKNITNLLLP